MLQIHVRSIRNKRRFYRSKQRRCLHKNEHDHVSCGFRGTCFPAGLEKLRRKSYKKVVSLDFHTREVWTALNEHLTASQSKQNADSFEVYMGLHTNTGVGTCWTNIDT